MYLTDEHVGNKASPEIMVVGGGKGGVGKTCFAVNMAVEIARKGWRVVLVDADLSCSNIETILGVDVDCKLDSFFHQHGVKDLSKIVSDTHYDNLQVIAGTTGLIDVANPKYQQKVAFMRHLKMLKADLIIIDLDAGAHLNTLDFFLMTADNGIVVITPERTSIDNAFKFLRSALYRKIERFYRSREVAVLLHRSQSLESFIELVRESDVFEGDIRDQIFSELGAIAASIVPRIVVNRARNAYEAQIACNILSKYCRQHLHIEPTNLGHMFFDKMVSNAINSGVPFIVSNPRAKISVCISDMANRLGYV